MCVHRDQSAVCMPFPSLSAQGRKFPLLMGQKAEKIPLCTKSPCTGGGTSPLLMQQKILLLLGWLTIQAGSLTSCFEVAEKNKLLRGLKPLKCNRESMMSLLRPRIRMLHPPAQSSSRATGLAAPVRPTQERNQVNLGISQEQSHTGRQ